MKPHLIWPEQCAAAREIQPEFGNDRAMTYLVGEKFINFLNAAETDEGQRYWLWIKTQCPAAAADDYAQSRPAICRTRCAC